jgi:adenosylcobinamide-phosphate synthase
MRVGGRVQALALLGAIGLDAALGEPDNRWHPVAGLGWLLDKAHQPLNMSSRWRQLLGGAAVLAGATSLAAGTGLALEGLLRKRKASLAIPALALALKPTFAWRQLRREALNVAECLDAGRLPEARFRLRALNSRPTADLDASLVAAAAISSLAENLCDSIVAPWFYYAAAGLPGAAAYRAVNTADAMFGYRGRLEWQGKVTAHTDDALNWLPSRIAAVALLLASPPVLGWQAARRGLKLWLTDANLTASPNAGRTMSVMAGCLGRRLEKCDHYVLGAKYRPPQATDIRRAARLVDAAAGAVATATALVLGARK